jgi:hypothetical protein
MALEFNFCFDLNTSFIAFLKSKKISFCAKASSFVDSRPQHYVEADGQLYALTV